MRHAVVTGSSSAIGKAVAERLLRDGWRVTGSDRAPATIGDSALRAVQVGLGDNALLRPVPEALDPADTQVTLPRRGSVARLIDII